MCLSLRDHTAKNRHFIIEKEMVLLHWACGSANSLLFLSNQIDATTELDDAIFPRSVSRRTS
jgi:hypothetical protein